MLIAVTRPEPDGERTAQALRTRGHEVLLAPLMRIEPVAVDLSGDWSAVAITSANALATIGDHVDALKHLPLFAVGRRSAASARGFSQVHSAGGNVHDLAGLIASEHRGGKLMYLAGEDRAADLVGELAPRGIAAEMRVVYRAVTLPYPRALISALEQGRVDAVLHFSRRSAENYVAGGRNARMLPVAVTPSHLCLSAQVAEPLNAAGAVQVQIAPQPDEAALLNLL